MWNIIFHVWCGFPCSWRALAVFQLWESSVKETISCWPVTDSWFKTTSVIKLHYWDAWSFFRLGVAVTLCPDFQMVLMLFINLEAFYLHGSQPGLNSLEVTKDVRAWGQRGSPKFIFGSHLTGQVNILPPAALGKRKWRWLSTQESCVFLCLCLLLTPPLSSSALQDPVCGCWHCFGTLVLRSNKGHGKEQKMRWATAFPGTVTT